MPGLAWVYQVTHSQSERASLHGLTPEDALRALLAVDPDELVEDEAEDDDTEGHADA